MDTNVYVKFRTPVAIVTLKWIHVYRIVAVTLLDVRQVQITLTSPVLVTWVTRVVYVMKTLMNVQFHHHAEMEQLVETQTGRTIVFVQKVMKVMIVLSTQMIAHRIRVKTGVHVLMELVITLACALMALKENIVRPISTNVSQILAKTELPVINTLTHTPVPAPLAFLE